MALALVISTCLAARGAASSVSEAHRLADAPQGLTAYGRSLWELDALLHDTFGKGPVFLKSDGLTAASRFTTNFVAVANGGIYAYTFADASRSTFKLAKPARPPRPMTVATGSSVAAATVPLTVRGAYISCGNGGWLYRVEGEGDVNEFTSCFKNGASPIAQADHEPASLRGLTTYGHDVWELDALLRETFGRRVVYLRQSQPNRSGWSPSDFTTKFVARARGGIYAYTFTDASHSTFKLVRPARRPQPWIGAAGASYLLTVRGAFISCGHDLWLYEDEAGGNTNQFVYCSRSDGPPSAQ